MIKKIFKQTLKQNEMRLVEILFSNLQNIKIEPNFFS